MDHEAGEEAPVHRYVVRLPHSVLSPTLMDTLGRCHFVMYSFFYPRCLRRLRSSAASALMPIDPSACVLNAQRYGGPVIYDLCRVN